MAQKGNFYRAYVKDPKTGKSIYLHKGPNDLGRSDIPKEDRCDPEEFNRIWRETYAAVMKYWDEAPEIDNEHEFDSWPLANEDDEE